MYKVGDKVTIKKHVEGGCCLNCACMTGTMLKNVGKTFTITSVFIGLGKRVIYNINDNHSFSYTDCMLSNKKHKILIKGVNYKLWEK